MPEPAVLRVLELPTSSSLTVSEYVSISPYCHNEFYSFFHHTKSAGQASEHSRGVISLCDKPLPFVLFLRQDRFSLRRAARVFHGRGTLDITVLSSGEAKSGL
jgi:hypothetical protein